MDNQSKTFNIALTGDSILTRRLNASKSNITKELVELIREADVAFTNLEVLPNNFKGYPAARTYGSHLAGHSWVLDELEEMGFNLFSGATNHAMDYGVEGLLSAIEELNKRNFAYAGIGETLTEARMPVYLDTPQGSVAMLSCTSTTYPEQTAEDPRPEIQGRPGVNPLGFETVYEITNEQFELLRDVAKGLGLERQMQEIVKLGMYSEQKDPTILRFIDRDRRASSDLNVNFRSAEYPAVRTKPNEKDTEEIIKWVREAKARTGLVIVSLHAHESIESGETRERPAEFIKTFARRIIDEGADIVVGHGPHLLRGMEMYQGKPIFYSLGNIVGQLDLIYKLPVDSYKFYGADQSLTPSEVYQSRNGNGKKGFQANNLYWQTVMPICRFEAGKLIQIEIVPVGLTNGSAAHERGKPYLAKDAEASEILQKFSELSLEFGTKIENGFVVME